MTTHALLGTAILFSLVGILLLCETWVSVREDVGDFLDWCILRYVRFVPGSDIWKVRTSIGAARRVRERAEIRKIRDMLW